MSNGKKLYVGNLNFKATEDDIRDLFNAYGDVANVTLIRDNMTGRARGFGFVEMASEEGATKAMDALKGQPFQERNLTIDWARPVENSGGGARRSGGYDRSAGGGRRNDRSSGGGYDRGGDRGGYRSY